MRFHFSGHLPHEEAGTLDRELVICLPQRLAQGADLRPQHRLCDATMQGRDAEQAGCTSKLVARH